jgi:hypothetical protein
MWQLVQWISWRLLITHNYKNTGRFSKIAVAFDEYLLYFAYEYIVYIDIYLVQMDLNSITLTIPIPKQMLAVSTIVWL